MLKKKIIPISNYAEYFRKVDSIFHLFSNGKIDAKTLNQAINRAYQENQYIILIMTKKILSVILYLTNDDF